MRSAGIIHQADTLVSSYGRPPDGNTHALRRFIGPLTDRCETVEYNGQRYSRTAGR